ncbi:hypothetical protein WR25_09350 [Diploscapter pachys]|uniref:LRRCT domain-containing protein n=1 Tax=Diploscapter pachys TaxID=2018661 RepID=A0A2A2L5F6_9BILA|nr:hypothetical protein WR25_09350 [Diploscapter pachys]
MSWPSPSSMLSLFLILTVPLANAVVYECPAECECDLMPPNNASWAVFCHRGGINDTKFAEILNRLPTTLRMLEIEAPSWRPRNKFKWNDNLNRFSQLRVLRLIGSGIPAISRSIRLPSLEILDLRHNQIEHATMSNFGGMPALRFLDLSSNKLSILPTGVFTYLRSLRSLSLARNNITDMSTNLLRGLGTLRALHLDGNPIPIKQINDVFSDVLQLEELYLNQCNLTAIANLSLDRIPHLRSLGLARNDLHAVPTAELHLLHRLSFLDLSGNQIREIGPCAFCSNNLTRLDLSHNLLGLDKDAFHADAFRNIPLYELDLSYNHLDNFESTNLGWAMDSIRILALSGNYIQGFPMQLTEKLTALTHLHMAYNDIEDIPLIFPPEYINLSCAIQNLQAHMRDRYALRHQLKYNEARCAEPKLFEGQPVLAVIEVNDCAVLFGARYGLTQSSELLILLGALLSAALALTMLLLCFYCIREKQYKGTYVTREHSRTPLTMSHNMNMSCSSSTSAASEPLSPTNPMLESISHHPIHSGTLPSPPKPAAAYFGI